MPGYVDLVQRVPDVQTDVTVLAFSLTFNRMFGIVVVVVLVVAFSPLIDVVASIVAEIAVAGNLKAEPSNLVARGIIGKEDETLIDGGANAFVRSGKVRSM